MRLAIYALLIFFVGKPTVVLSQQDAHGSYPTKLVLKTPEVLVHAIHFYHSPVSSDLNTGNERLAIVATDLTSGKMTILHSNGIHHSASRAGGLYEVRIIGIAASGSHLFVAGWDFSHKRTDPIDNLRK